MKILPQTTVAQIAATLPRAIPVFQKYGIDFCCGGKRPIEEICTEKGVSLDTLQAEIDSAISIGPQDEPDPETARLAALIVHIVGRYHAALRVELPLLDGLIGRVLEAHGATQGTVLEQVRSTFRALRDEMELHMQKEERVLFPYIEGLELVAEGRRPAETIPLGLCSAVVPVMEREHESAGASSMALRRLTQGYTPPEGACPTFRALYTGLAKLDHDLERHVHLENNVLFPRALRIESGLLAHRGAAA